MIYLLLVVGFVLMFGLGYFVRSRMGRLVSYAGTMHVLREEDKIVYRFELDEEPEEFPYMDEVVFKVVNSVELSGRK